MSAVSGLFIIDFFVRPFGKIFEKMPFLMLFILLVLYGYIAYLIYRSVQADQGT